jgi:hypothetical protein
MRSANGSAARWQGPFRQLEIRIDFEELQQRLQEGIISGHPAMPTFILSAAEARALIIYLKAIRE